MAVSPGVAAPKFVLYFTNLFVNTNIKQMYNRYYAISLPGNYNNNIICT